MGLIQIKYFGERVEVRWQKKFGKTGWQILLEGKWKESNLGFDQRQRNNKTE